MLSNTFAGALLGTLLLAVTFTSSTARAADDVAPPSAPAPAVAAAPAPVGPVADDNEKGPEFKSVALTVNPLSLLLGRIGINAEYMLAPHHGIMLNPYFSSQSASSGGDKTSYKSFGGELGYHFYTGSKGANGFFIGPQLIFIRSSTDTECSASSLCSNTESHFSAYGVAVDLGGQHVFDNGFTIGGGVGLMYLKASADLNNTSSTVKFEGTLPRFLFMVGYSF